MKEEFEIKFLITSDGYNVDINRLVTKDKIESYFFAVFCKTTAELLNAGLNEKIEFAKQMASLAESRQNCCCDED